LPRPKSATSEEAYRAIEKGLGLTSPNPALRNQLARCVQKWRDQQGPDLTSIKLSKLEAAIRKIGNDAYRLGSDLNRAEGDSQDAWDYEGAIIELGISPALAKELRRISDLAKEWHNAQAKGESGRPANSVLRCLIHLYDDLHTSGHRSVSLPLPKQRDSLEKAIRRSRREADKTSTR